MSILNRSAHNEEKLILGDEKNYSDASEKNLTLQLQLYCGAEEGGESVDASLGNEMNTKATGQ